MLTPELAMTGYPPQDLVLKSRFVPENLELLAKLHARVGDAALLVGFVDRNEGRGKPFRNAAALLERGKPIRKTYKSLLPTYDVFDEERYFEPAERVEPFLVHGKKIGVTICEDIWTEHYLPRPLYDCEPVRSLVEQGAEIIVNLSSSPFSLHKPAIRYEMVAGLARAHQRPISYCNLIGGNDQLIFDGNSFAVNSAGNVIAQLAAFREDGTSRRYGFDFGNRISRRQNTGANFCRALSRAPRLLSQMQLPLGRAWFERRNRFRCYRGHRS